MIRPPLPCGRFAPSPTGPLHMGSLVAALGSYLNVRQQGGKWLVRIDDIDSPRNVPQMDQQILRTLEHHGLEWDDTVYYSSDHLAEYDLAFALLTANQQVFACSCSRREIASHQINIQRQSGETLIYPGICRAGVAAHKSLRSYRVRVSTLPITFMDRFQGPQTHSLAESVGDFVVKDAQGQYHYQLATVIDDHNQLVTEVVRGADLLASTARQVHLQDQLGYSQPCYLHLPLVTDKFGAKLSKQQGAAAIDSTHPCHNLIFALELLQQQPPQDLRLATPGEIIVWATEHWNVAPLKSRSRSPLPDQ